MNRKGRQHASNSAQNESFVSLHTKEWMAMVLKLGNDFCNSSQVLRATNVAYVVGISRKLFKIRQLIRAGSGLGGPRECNYFLCTRFFNTCQNMGIVNQTAGLQTLKECFELFPCSFLSSPRGISYPSEEGGEIIRGLVKKLPIRTLASVESCDVFCVITRQKRISGDVMATNQCGWKS